MKRRSAGRSAQRKIAFLVDGDKHKLFVEALAQGVVARHRPESQPCFATIRLAGTPRAGVFSVVEVLLTKNYERFLIVFDAGTTNKRRISSMISEIQEPLIRARLMDKVSLIPMVPSIESWVLADEEALERVSGTSIADGVSRGRSRPEDLLRELLGGWGPKEQRRMARYLDPERIRAKNASFDAFARALESALGGRAHPPPAEQEPAVT
jgi:hypothetical protein